MFGGENRETEEKAAMLFRENKRPRLFYVDGGGQLYYRMGNPVTHNIDRTVRLGG